ncbi:MAG: glycyl-radical enzyme activating protein, partial [Melioribacteraceae bacterium]|nr:glycyl-radical enzyme activating protein [Melioribacteraceae bacterium]
GIRTTIFFKGCPLTCWWCHNPESQRKLPEEFSGCNLRWNFSPDENEKDIIGSSASVKDIMDVIIKDIPFYDQSKGGVTFSGGEPLLQHEFLTSLLIECRKHDIHTAIDTSGYADISIIKNIAEYADLFLYDLKLINDKLHTDYSGVSNKIILDNLSYLTGLGKKVIIRVPIIPGITSTDENINSILDYISGLKNIEGISLLPFHKTGFTKYENMNKINKLPLIEPPSEEYMIELKNQFTKAGFNTGIGG